MKEMGKQVVACFNLKELSSQRTIFWLPIEVTAEVTM